MATTASYYLNAPSLGSATSVFTNEGLSTLAPDGFYSNGVIVREQVGGVLLPQQTCPSCATYNCVTGECVDPGDGTGTYSTLEACQAACGEVGTSAILAWSYTSTNFAVGTMDLYINGSIAESRNYDASGNITVYEGDTINVQVTCNQCDLGLNTYANAYCVGIIGDADCTNNGIASIFTAVYTVTNADLGTILTLNSVARCDSGCV